MASYTFVLPVYNTERYLEECVQSILNQTYKKFKVLLVDDGSTDSSYEICQRLAAADSRISVKQVSNGGPARIRNIGIKECDSDYIWFVDSDDRLASNTVLEKLNGKIEESGADMIFFLSAEYDADYSNVKKVQKPYIFDGAVDKNGEELLVALGTQENIVSIGTSPVNKMIKRSLLQDNELYFVEHFRWHAEDEFLSKAIFHANGFYFFNEEVYQVRIRPNSITTTVNTAIIEKKMLTKFELADMCFHFFEKNAKTPQLKQTMFTYFSYYYLFGVKDYFRLETKAQRKNVKVFSLGRPFVFQAMKQSDSRNVRLLSKLFRYCGWTVALKFIQWRYCR